MMNSTHIISSSGTITTAGNSIRPCKQPQNPLSAHSFSSDSVSRQPGTVRTLSSCPTQKILMPTIPIMTCRQPRTTSSCKPGMCTWHAEPLEPQSYQIIDRARYGHCMTMGFSAHMEQLTIYVYQSLKMLLPSMRSTRTMHRDVAKSTACAPRMPANETPLSNVISSLTEDLQRSFWDIVIVSTGPHACVSRAQPCFTHLIATGIQRHALL